MRCDICDRYPDFGTVYRTGCEHHEHVVFVCRACDPLFRVLVDVEA